jgi:hypothetical protein
VTACPKFRRNSKAQAKPAVHPSVIFSAAHQTDAAKPQQSGISLHRDD